MNSVFVPDRGIYSSVYEFSEKMKDKPTKCEKIVAGMFKECGIENDFQFVVVANWKCYILDFRVYSNVICKWIDLEVDGAYHYKDEQMAKDAERTENLVNGGYEVIRIKNREVRGRSFKGIIIEKFKGIGASDIVDKIKEWNENEVQQPVKRKRRTKKSNRTTTKRRKQTKKRVTTGVIQDCFWWETC